MLKVAVVGCGKIAATHVSQIRAEGGSEIIGVFSRNVATARTFCDRHAIPRCFESLSALLEGGRPDVVHITTPPDSHFALTEQCLLHGAHVYVEKPFTLDAGQCAALIRIASTQRLKMTVGHNQQFTPAARRVRSLISRGYLGGPPVHLESHYGYDLGDQIYARAVLDDRNHWVRGLPGQLLHNVLSHGVARISEHLDADDPNVVALGFTSDLLREKGESDLIDELRVIIRGRATAYLTFSSQMRPVIHTLRIFGPRNGVVLDQDHELVIQLRGNKFRSHLDTLVPPLLFAAQDVKNFGGNVARLLTGNLHMNSGMRYLIRAFYRSVREDTSVPIPHREIMLTAKIMDRIFEQLRAQGRQPRPADDAALTVR